MEACKEKQVLLSSSCSML